MLTRGETAVIAVGATAAVGGGLLWLAWQQGWLTSLGIPKPAASAAARARQVEAERARQAQELADQSRQRPYPVGPETGYTGYNLPRGLNTNSGASNAGAARFAYRPNGPLEPRPAVPEQTPMGITQAANAQFMRRLAGSG